MHNIHLLGIRHHGPGCTRNLEKALHKIQPDIVLLEMAADVPQKVLEGVMHPNIEPPVALLMYNPDDLKQAAFYPFAEYSPEWKTLQYCFKNQVHIRPFDLPKSLDFGLALMRTAEMATNAELTEEELARQVNRDPIAYIAELAGYTDSERWWDAVIESSGEDTEIFQSIVEMMTALRQNLGIVESQETLLREAFMRETLRDVIKIGYKNIAIVCGAWHTPALLEVDFQKKEDPKLLKGIKKTKVAHSWIPWTYDRLSFSSGYGAGVISPAWYEILYHQDKENVVTYWMTRAAQLLRKQDLDASSAHVIEAVRLAETLAVIRGLAISGLDEMLEATTAIFGGGYPDKLNVIEKELVVGTKMGKVPDELQNIPFYIDLLALRKTYRLKEDFYNDLKIDLREPAGANKSQFLHRLLLLGIRWGDTPKTSQDSSKSRTTTGEIWSLKWKPELMLNVIEASMWGNTVLDAAENYVTSKAKDSDDIRQLATLVEQCQMAGLEKAISNIIVKLRDLTTLSSDIPALIEVVPKLISTERYANTVVKKIEISLIQQMIHNLIPRIYIGIIPACSGLNEDAADGMWESINRMTATLELMQDEEFSTMWLDSLEKITQKTQIEGKIIGGITRTLYNKGIYDQATSQKRMSLALSKGNEPVFSTRWIGGYLAGSITILIHRPEFLSLIHLWLKELNDESFQEVVVLLRRIFKDYPLPERQKIFEMAINGWKAPKIANEMPLNPERLALINQKWQDWMKVMY